MKPVFDKQAHNKQYYLLHREELLAHQNAYNADHGGERRSYAAAHREERRAYDAAHRSEQRAYNAAYYQSNRDETLKAFAEFTEWLQILRANNGCEDCETHEGRLLHHHVDPDTKRHNVSDMATSSLDALEDELEKCVVLCDACHAKRHGALGAQARAAA